MQCLCKCLVTPQYLKLVRVPSSYFQGQLRLSNLETKLEKEGREGLDICRGGIVGKGC